MGFPVVIMPLMSEFEWDWILQRARPVKAEDSTGFVAYRGTKLVGAVVFDSWSPNACMAHIAIEDPFILRHGLLEASCDFVFRHANRGVIIGLVPANNEKALRFDRHIGFTEVYRIKDGYAPDIDYVLMEMRRETCRWLKPRNSLAA